jgi:glucosylceramidase
MNGRCWRRRRLVPAALATALIAAMSAPTAIGTAYGVGETVQVTLTTADGSNNMAAKPAITMGSVSSGAINVSVNDSITSQIMSGFGASFTDSSTYLLAQLKTSSPTQYNSLMNDIFNTSTGLGESFWRLPMTSNDFNSTSTEWTDDDVAGPSSNYTQNFALTAQDTGHIIPVIKDALAINPNLKILASPWSAPAWMKSNGSMNGSTGGVNGTLVSTYNQAWADYFVKWIKAYQTAGVPIWAVTPQNEPLYAPSDYPGMYWTEPNEAAWVHTYLKPSLTAAGLSQPILGFDHNWEFFTFPQSLLTSVAAADEAGIAWHCYDAASDPTAMTMIHNQDPTKDAYETECSSDTSPTDIISYGTGDMAELSTQNWAKGVVTWNLALDANGGPHLGGCVGCVGLLTINGTTVTKRNNYYQFGQLAKFVKVGATHIASTVNAHGVTTSAFKNPTGEEVLVATNTNSASTTFTVTWNGKGSFSYTLPSRATVTFVATVGAATVLSTTPSAGHTFKIQSRQTGKPIDIAGGSTSAGALAVQYTDSGDTSQQWRLADAGSGYFNLINVHSGMALDDTGGSLTNGTQMQQYTITGTGNSNQQWQLVSVGSGYYKIINRTSGLGLDLSGGSLSDSTSIQQYTVTGSGNYGQNWTFSPIS